MTQVWDESKSTPVTVLEVQECPVAQIKNVEKDGYRAVQIGFGLKKKKNIKKPQIGHLKKMGILDSENNHNIRYLKEFRVSEEDLLEEINVGDYVSVDTFEIGDKIDVVASSKGKGFQGVVKRYGFKGALKTHGTKDQVRMPGSIGATGPARVFKGVRMGGRMGGKRITVKNLEIVKVDIENNQLYIKGAVPGTRNGIVMLKGQGKLKVKGAKSKLIS